MMPLQHAGLNPAVISYALIGGLQMRITISVRPYFLPFALGVGTAFLAHLFVTLGYNLSRVGLAGSYFPETLPSIWVNEFSTGITVLLYAAIAISLVVLGAAGLRNRSAHGAHRLAQVDQFEDSSNLVEQGQATAQALLDQQFNELLAMIASYLERNNVYCAEVARVQDQLASSIGIDQVKLLVHALIRQSTEALCDARSLRAQLIQAQEHSLAIRQRLSKAEHLIRLDPLTSVANRRSLDEFLERETAQSHQESTPLSVIMADIDFFKKINDTYGHQMGDEVLKGFAQLIQLFTRSTDLTARYGGEEFTIVLPKTSMGDAFQIAERVRQSLDRKVLISADGNRPLVKVTASFGIAEIQDGESAAQLLHRADGVLYDAKRNGRNRVETSNTDCFS